MVLLTLKGCRGFTFLLFKSNIKIFKRQSFEDTKEQPSSQATKVKIPEERETN